MKKMILALVAVAGLASAAVDFNAILVRQQWPWSANIVVEYTLANTAGRPCNVQLAAFDGDTPLALPVDALSGDMYGMTGDGLYRIVIDPVKAFGSETFSIANFKVKLETAEAAANLKEVIYKVYDLTDGSCQDVTRADILNGKMGSYETDFGKIGPGFNTSETDVLIWTGVTNDIVYKTTKLVMRKIPAANKVWTMGDSAAVRSAAQNQKNGEWETNHLVKITYDYWAGVFEVTRKQFELMVGTHGAANDDPDADCLPEGKLVNGNYGAAGPYAKRFAQKLRDKTGVSGFDLPSEAEWEFACRAGTSTSLNSGLDATVGWWSECDVNVARIAWMKGNSDGVLHPVGVKSPNAFGLYDMLGNVMEYTRDTRGGTSEAYIASFGSGWTPETIVVDPASPQGGYDLLKGAAGNSYGAYVRSGDRTFNVQNWTTPNEFYGFRIFMKE